MTVLRTVGRLDEEDLFWALYVLAVVAYGIYTFSKSAGRREGRERAEERQEREEAFERARRRDDLRLGEEALCHLEHGGTVELDRWHGGELTVTAEEIVVDVTEGDESS